MRKGFLKSKTLRPTELTYLSSSAMWNEHQAMISKSQIDLPVRRSQEPCSTKIAKMGEIIILLLIALWSYWNQYSFSGQGCPLKSDQEA